MVVLLLPAFFAFTGMRTQIGLVSGAEHWLLCALIILVACVGKFGGSVVAARLTGLGWRDVGGARRPDEHARPDGADRAQHRPGSAGDLADAVRDAGDHGAGDHFATTPILDALSTRGDRRGNESAARPGATGPLTSPSPG